MPIRFEVAGKTVEVDSPSEAVAVLRMLAMNPIINAPAPARTSAPAPIQVPISLPVAGTSMSASPATKSATAWDAESVTRMMQRLSDACRKTLSFLLRQGHQVSTREIAAFLSMPTARGTGSLLSGIRHAAAAVGRADPLIVTPRGEGPDKAAQIDLTTEFRRAVGAAGMGTGP